MHEGSKVGCEGEVKGGKISWVIFCGDPSKERLLLEVGDGIGELLE